LNPRLDASLPVISQPKAGAPTARARAFNLKFKTSIGSINPYKYGGVLLSICGSSFRKRSADRHFILYYYRVLLVIPALKDIAF
jgi:hypothetical protein